ncbi:hypothetical protein BV22DRAFT_689347 [Leucogyrophana mollusca]|uniref:Uncharacterized protein n=1 Tax=Leucogyrophana mollusca TaxID=85980 RepID=A0ACB8B840_9AGAM|nr:hypothetical protein BV22DRAFT_689347 [Leucogyrophana mollusca]
MFLTRIIAHTSTTATVNLPGLTPIRIIFSSFVLLLVPHCHYPATLGRRPIQSSMASNAPFHPAAEASASTSTSSIGQILGRKFHHTLTRSRLPVLSKLRIHPRSRRTFLLPAPIPLAPVLDTYAFHPPPPYSADPEFAEETDLYLSVPNNTPVGSPLSSLTSATGGSSTTNDSLASSVDISLGTPYLLRGGDRAQTTSRSSLGSGSTGTLVGLGLEGIEKMDGSQFDGLGRLSGGFRSSLGNRTTGKEPRATSDELENELHREMTLSVIARARRSRAKTIIQPRARYDVFFPPPAQSLPPPFVEQSLPRADHVRLRRHRPVVATPTPASRGSRPCQLQRDLSRSTTSTELKRVANLERRASFVGTKGRVTWRG